MVVELIGSKRHARCQDQNGNGGLHLRWLHDFHAISERVLSNLGTLGSTTFLKSVSCRTPPSPVTARPCFLFRLVFFDEVRRWMAGRRKRSARGLARLVMGTLRVASEARYGGAPARARCASPCSRTAR